MLDLLRVRLLASQHTGRARLREVVDDSEGVVQSAVIGAPDGGSEALRVRQGVCIADHHDLSRIRMLDP
jgi:hypothetical protein